MEYSKERLDQLHSTLLEILIYIDDVCKKNNIRYFLDGGTLLGAKRHSGFIPWDDDLDITMPRQDYDKFCTIMHKNTNPLYKIQDKENEKNYFLQFVKVRKEGTVFKEKISDGLYQDNGIFVDVFPLDSFDEIESIKVRRNFKLAELIKLRLAYIYCKKYYKEKCSAINYIKMGVKTLPLLVYSKDELFKKFDKIARSYSEKGGKYVGCIAGTLPIEKCLMNEADVFPLKTINFENMSFPCPNNVDSYLTKLYGDYMTLPPVEKRHTHEPLELKF